jgi:hypothetical protein
LESWSIGVKQDSSDPLLQYSTSNVPRGRQIQPAFDPERREKIRVMTCHEQGSIIVAESGFDRGDRIEIEVIRRFIENSQFPP